jgi:predicted ArsR family transcriptional regulator
VDWLTTLAGETRSRLLRLVRGAASSINELADALGITDNAVRTHVAALERDGLVRQAGTDRTTGGKPARLYELTAQAEELFPKAYALVLTEFVRALREERGDEAAVAWLRRVGRRLGADSAHAQADGAARVAAAGALLESIGGTVEVNDLADGWMIRSHGCPLAGVVAEDPDVCALAESLVTEVTARRVVERCEKTGRPRCAFHVLEEPPTARKRSRS